MSEIATQQVYEQVGKITLAKLDILYETLVGYMLSPKHRNDESKERMEAMKEFARLQENFFRFKSSLQSMSGQDLQPFNWEDKGV